MVDGRCGTCGNEQENLFLDEDEVSTCASCGGVLEQIWWRRPRGPAQWDDRTAVLVFQDANGNLRYPGRSDTPCPKGYEPIRLRSLREVERFEREHNVRSEMTSFDPGSGRGHDDYYTRRLNQMLPSGEIVTRTVQEKVTH